MAIVPDNAKVIAEGHLSSHFDHEMGALGWEPTDTGGEKFSWTTKVRPPSAILDNVEARKRQTVPINLTVFGTAHHMRVQQGTSFASFPSGEVTLDIPYEAIDGLIEALQKAKAAVPEVVAENYREHDEWVRQCEELNKPRGKRK